MANDERTCAHAGCKCSLEASGTNEAPVEQNGQSYCSRGCADGDGCQHSGCNCVVYEASL